VCPGNSSKSVGPSRLSSDNAISRGLRLSASEVAPWIRDGRLNAQQVRVPGARSSPWAVDNRQELAASEGGTGRLP